MGESRREWREFLTLLDRASEEEKKKHRQEHTLGYMKQYTRISEKREDSGERERKTDCISSCAWRSTSHVLVT